MLKGGSQVNDKVTHKEAVQALIKYDVEEYLRFLTGLSTEQIRKAEKEGVRLPLKTTHVQKGFLSQKIT